MRFLQRLERQLLCSLYCTEQQFRQCQCQLTLGPRLHLHPFKDECPLQRPFSPLQHARPLFTFPRTLVRLNVEHHCLHKAYAAQNNQRKPDTSGNTQGAAQKSLGLIILCSSQMHIAQVTADNSDFTLAVVLFKGSQRTIPAISCFCRLTSTGSNQPEQGMRASKLYRVSCKDTPD